MASVRHFEFAKFWFFKNIHPRNGNSHPCTKFDRNQIIHGWYMEIKPFSKWRPSAILNLQKLPFWSRILYLHVILHLRSKFRIIGYMAPRYSQKTIFNMASVRHLKFVMTSSYSIRKPHFTFPNCAKFSRRSVAYFLKCLNCISCFSILAWNCLFRA